MGYVRENVDDQAEVTLTMPRPALLMTLFAGADLQPLLDRGEIRVEGDIEAYVALRKALVNFDPAFNIVTP